MVLGKQLVVIGRIMLEELIENQSQVMQVVTLIRLVELLQLILVVLQLQMHKDRAETYPHSMLLRILSNMLKVELLLKDRKEKLVLQVLVVALVIKDKKVK